MRLLGRGDVVPGRMARWHGWQAGRQADWPASRQTDPVGLCVSVEGSWFVIRGSWFEELAPVGFGLWWCCRFFGLWIMMTRAGRRVVCGGEGPVLSQEGPECRCGGGAGKRVMQR